MYVFRIALLVLCCVADLGAADATASTLDKVRTRGLLRCGLVEQGPGLATQESDGRWTGFYPDFCRAFAAAVVGNADRVEMVNTSITNGFEALTTGSVDILVQGKTWTLHRDVDQQVSFPALYLFDGQAFMSHRSEEITKLRDLRGKTVCTAKGSTTEAHVAELNQSQGLDLKIETYKTIQIAYSSFFIRECVAVADDATGLAANRSAAGADPTDYVILAERPFKEALFPVVRKDDAAWSDVVRWVVNATIAAEELGISSANIGTVAASAQPAVRQFLGMEPGLGSGLGLKQGWTVLVVKAVGNYGEIYERNIGMRSPLKLERGLNRLWNQGGVMWAPPFN